MTVVLIYLSDARVFERSWLLGARRHTDGVQGEVVAYANDPCVTVVTRHSQLYDRLNKATRHVHFEIL